MQQLQITEQEIQNLQAQNLMNTRSMKSYICVLCKKGIDGDVDCVANYPEETGLPMHDECSEWCMQNQERVQSDPNFFNRKVMGGNF